MISFLRRTPNWTPNIFVSDDGTTCALLIQKNASRSVRPGLRGPTPHPQKRYIRPVLELPKVPCTRFFYVVRDPVSRFMSLLAHVQKVDPTATFDELFAYAKQEVGHPECDPHIRPQSEFLAFLNGDSRFKRVVIEDLGSHLYDLGYTSKNVGSGNAIQIPTDEQFTSIKSLYSSDISL